MIPEIANFEAFTQAVGNVPTLKHVFNTNERLRYVLMWYQSLPRTETLQLTQEEVEVLEGFPFDSVCDSMKLRSRAIAEISKNVMLIENQEHLRRYLKGLYDRISYRVKWLDKMNYPDIVFSDEFQPLGISNAKLYYTFITHLNIHYYNHVHILEALNDYLVQNVGVEGSNNPDQLTLLLDEKGIATQEKYISDYAIPVAILDKLHRRFNDTGLIWEPVNISLFIASFDLNNIPDIKLVIKNQNLFTFILYQYKQISENPHINLKFAIRNFGLTRYEKCISHNKQNPKAKGKEKGKILEELKGTKQLHQITGG